MKASSTGLAASGNRIFVKVDYITAPPDWGSVSGAILSGWKNNTLEAIAGQY